MDINGSKFPYVSLKVDFGKLPMYIAVPRAIIKKIIQNDFKKHDT